jgi:cysteine-rich repeat protein
MINNKFIKSVSIKFFLIILLLNTVSALDPISYWSFDNQSNPGADDADGNDGILNGAVWTSCGYKGGAISLDGSSHVLVADDDSLDVQLSNGFTFASWIKPNNTDNFPVITKADANLLVGSYEFYVRQGDRHLDCYVSQNANSYRGRASSIVFPDDGQFHHVACTWDGLFTLDSLHLYIDGIQVDGTTAGRTFGTPTAMRVDSTPLKIGTFNNYPGFANGIIDETVLFDYLLTPLEINELMGSGVTPSICGNNILDSCEQCDDGNVINGDGCDDSCQIEIDICGNGIIGAGEQCDDGNMISGDGCSDSCLIETSDSDGDGIDDIDDLCPGTIDEQIINGCSCTQILDSKPGNGIKNKVKDCPNGLINVFLKNIGWAK